MSEDIRPTPNEIEAALAEMMTERSQASDWDEDDLWWVEAIDPAGETQGYGTDDKIPEAAVAAWISACDEDNEALRRWYDGTPISKNFYDSVPRHVPAGWTFKVNRHDEIAFELKDGVTPDDLVEAFMQMLRPEPKN